MSNRACFLLSNAVTAVALGVVFLCLGAGLCVSAQESTKGLDGPTRDSKGTRTFRNGIGMTEVENMIDSSAGGCPSPLVIKGKGVFHFPPCLLVEKLKAAFAKSSESEPLSAFLEKNYFKCTKVATKRDAITRSRGSSRRDIHSPESE